MAFKNFVAIIIFLLKVEKKDSTLEFRKKIEDGELILEIGNVINGMFIINNELTYLTKQLVENISKEKQEIICEILMDNFSKSIPEYEKYFRYNTQGLH